jgi:hypothetical protein
MEVWTSNQREPGRPQILPRTTYAQVIREIIATGSAIKCAAHKWVAKATDLTTWRNLKKHGGKKIQQSQTQSTNNGYFIGIRLPVVAT